MWVQMANQIMYALPLASAWYAGTSVVGFRRGIPMDQDELALAIASAFAIVGILLAVS
jgi:hypothetical protein